MLCYVPVVQQMWKQHELWDGTYKFNDLIDILEALYISNMSKKLAYDDAMSKVDFDSNFNKYSRSMGRKMR